MKQMEQMESAHQAPVHLLPSSRREFPIISGEFIPEEAREQVIALLMDKIKYYGLRSLSSFERNGETDHESEAMIKELKHEIEQVLALLNHAESQGKTLRVESEIKISLV